MATPPNAPAPTISITNVWTSNPHDEKYHHCFEQDNSRYLYFDVKTDLSVDTINFALWNLNDPVNPYMAEPSTDWPVKNGHVKITIGPDLHVHLGPGPYCAALTASSSTAASKDSRKIVGNALYYYETWKDSRDCKYEK